MVIATVPLLVCIIGGVLYFVVNNAKVADLARLAFFVGLLWLVYAAAHTSVHL